MQEHPLKTIMDADPELFNLTEITRTTALGEGSIPLKYKLLIAMALDAAAGAADGVKVLAMQAMAEGVTKEEIMEALRVTQYVAGVGSVYVAARGLQDVL
ncbi:carboxymuconolactone decarboxylase family protein [Methanolobus halotolerans]|uniref:Carboxymuconolactone decarboxylase family protein n=1 Tax=Methanolobus halotolerans TaxID=2052935 RepID=A0A4E0Q918_9EURY|nr:carboxymuconolactone decarboxylase family protein [Methanolobus halotolerans]TGC11390.1 carboxymuconolactone decarboxylase family protein [Methanolobus halotolerans]